MSGNAKCKKCGKTVYKAEERRFDDPKEGVVILHGICFGIWKKEREQEQANFRNREYNKVADVTPEYYRVADPGTGQPARMESSKGSK